MACFLAREGSSLHSVNITLDGAGNYLGKYPKKAVLRIVEDAKNWRESRSPLQECSNGHVTTVISFKFFVSNALIGTPRRDKTLFRTGG